MSERSNPGRWTIEGPTRRARAADPGAVARACFRRGRRTGPVARARGLAVLLLAAIVPGPACAVWVACQQGARAERIADGAVARSIVLGAPVATIVAAADGRVYASHPDGGVSAIDAAGIVRRIPVPGQPFGLAVAGGSLYVGDWAGGRVLRLAEGSGAVEAEVRVGRDPAGLVLGPPGRLYVAEREDRAVGVIDIVTMTRVASIPVGEGPFALAYDAILNRLYVANVRSNDLSVIDAATERPLATLRVGATPYGVAVSPDGARILVANQLAGTVTVVAAGSLAVLATVPVGRYPEGVAIEDGRAYVANWFSDDVSVIDLATLRETARIAVAEGPRGLAAEPQTAGRLPVGMPARGPR